jgi:5-formyltetrahydrofolate cyclo-ligase
VLTPLVAFDLHGNRLGMGGGFYDRTFEFLNRHTHWRRPLLIGLAYDFQRVEQLYSHGWDVRLSGVVTEQGFVSFRHG